MELSGLIDPQALLDTRSYLQDYLASTTIGIYLREVGYIM